MLIDANCLTCIFLFSHVFTFHFPPNRAMLLQAWVFLLRFKSSDFLWDKVARPLCVFITAFSQSWGPNLTYPTELWKALPLTRGGPEQREKDPSQAQRIKHKYEIKESPPTTSSSLFLYSPVLSASDGCRVEVVSDNLIWLWWVAERDKRGQGMLEVWWAADCRAVQ